MCGLHIHNNNEFTWLGMEKEVVLVVEWMVLEDLIRRGQGTELVQLEVAELARVPHSRPVLSAPRALEEVRQVDLGQAVLRVAGVDYLLPENQLWRRRELDQKRLPPGVCRLRRRGQSGGRGRRRWRGGKFFGCLRPLEAVCSGLDHGLCSQHGDGMCKNPSEPKVGVQIGEQGGE